MALLQPQQALRLHAKGAYAQVCTGLHQGLPQRSAVLGRHMDFVTPLPNKTHAHCTRRNAGHIDGAHAQIGKGATVQVGCGQRGQKLARLWPSQIHTGKRAGMVNDAAVHTPHSV